MKPRTLVTVLVIAVLAGCTTAQPPSSTTTTEPTTTTAPVTSTTEPTATTTLPDDEGVLPAALDAMPGAWRELFFIPYGETPESLSTYLGGDGEGIQIGPDYGAQTADGTWWFLDTGKFRLAHYSETGEYLGEILIPESMLVSGVYFQHTLPRSLDDGTFLAAHLSGARTTFLMVKDGELESFSIPFEMLPRIDDGVRIYGFTFDDASDIVAVDPSTANAEIVDTFRTRTDDGFRLSGGAGGLIIDLLDAGTTIELDFEAAIVGGPVYISVEAASDTDGTLHLFLLGFPERDESIQLAGYMTISASGEVSHVEPVINPFSTADTGSPARLGVRPGTTEVWFMHVGMDGVRVYGR